nr:cysteine-rich receptor-like protein kinase [Tanacetum cinerariifolium]
MAFIAGRQILDGCLISNEIVKFAKKEGIELLIFKVDFEKSFNSINWKFLLDVMRQMGFESKWCKWIEACLPSALVSVLENSSPTDEFQMEQGIRQGNPLFLFLFLLVAETLLVLVLEAFTKGVFTGLFLDNNGSNVSSSGVDPAQVEIVANAINLVHEKLPLFIWPFLLAAICEWHGNWAWRSNPSGRVAADLVNMIRLVGDLALSPDSRDR